MNKTSAKVFLIVFGNLLIPIIGVGTFFLGWAVVPVLGSPLLFPVIGAVILAGHIVGSAFAQKRFWEKYGLSEGRFVLYGTLPGAAFVILGAAAIFILMGCGFKGFFFPPVDMVYGGVEFCIAICAAAYAVPYLIILTGVMQSREQKRIDGGQHG